MLLIGLRSLALNLDSQTAGLVGNLKDGNVLFTPGFAEAG